MKNAMFGDRAQPGQFMAELISEASFPSLDYINVSQTISPAVTWPFFYSLSRDTKINTYLHLEDTFQRPKSSSTKV